ncbi:hypothetical protein [Ekhidna sp. To15]|uniref:hypothetical protein n=1 Tax=Ekhidna sp. To15 TaxID=3395267 RepID=UPI003F52559A
MESHQTNSHWKVLNLLFGLGTSVWIILLIFFKQTAFDLVDEDGVVEWLQVILFFVSAVLLLRLSCFHYKLELEICVGYFFLGLGLLFICGEELSWGERLLSTNYLESLRQYNAQNETNLHNLFPFQRYRHWLLIIFGFAGLLYAQFVIKTELHKTVRVFQPTKRLSFLLILILLSGIAPEIGYFIRSISSFPDQAYQTHLKFARSTEIGEFFISITTLIYAISKFKRFKSSRQ